MQDEALASSRFPGESEFDFFLRKCPMKMLKIAFQSLLISKFTAGHAPKPPLCILKVWLQPCIISFVKLRFNFNWTLPCLFIRSGGMFAIPSSYATRFDRPQTNNLRPPYKSAVGNIITTLHNETQDSTRKRRVTSFLVLCVVSTITLTLLKTRKSKMVHKNQLDQILKMRTW